MVGGDDEHAVVAQQLENLRKAAVKRLERAGKAGHVVAMAIEHVRVHEVRKQQAAPVFLLHIFDDRVGTRLVAGGVIGLRQSAVVEDVLDLADPQHVHAVALDDVEHRLSDGIDREIAAVAGAHKRAGIADKRARDDAADAVFALQDAARDAADVPQLRRRHDGLVRSDLKDAVGRGVDDQLAGADVLRPQPLDDLRAGSDAVADRAHARLALKFVDHFLGKAVWIGRKGLLKRQARQLPVAGRGVLARGALQHRAIAADGIVLILGVHANGLQQAHLRQIWNLRMLLFDDVAQRVRAHIAIFVRVRLIAGAGAVQHHQNHMLHPFHALPSQRSISAMRAIISPQVGLPRLASTVLPKI